MKDNNQKQINSSRAHKYENRTVSSNSKCLKILDKSREEQIKFSSTNYISRNSPAIPKHFKDFDLSIEESNIYDLIII